MRNYFDYLQYLQEGGKNSMGTTGSIPTTGGAGFVPRINYPTNKDVTKKADFFIAPELKELNSDEVKTLQKIYGLTENGVIDKSLVDALTKDMYRSISKFDLSNPKDQHECAKYVNNQVRKRIENSSRLGRIKANFLGTHGNAWTIDSLLGKKIFDLYDDESIKDIDITAGDYSWGDTIKDINNNYNYDWSSLRIGDIVGLEYIKSPNHQIAASETGRPINTHVGVIAGYDNKGNPIVSHNIHGKVYNESLSGQGKTHGGFVTSVYRPKYAKGGFIQKYGEGEAIQYIPEITVTAKRSDESKDFEPFELPEIRGTNHYLTKKGLNWHHAAYLGIPDNHNVGFYIDYGSIPSDRNQLGVNIGKNNGNYREIVVTPYVTNKNNPKYGQVINNPTISDYIETIKAEVPYQQNSEFIIQSGTGDINYPMQLAEHDAYRDNRDKYNVLLKNCATVASEMYNAGIDMSKNKPIGESAFPHLNIRSNGWVPFLTHRISPEGGNL